MAFATVSGVPTNAVEFPLAPVATASFVHRHVSWISLFAAADKSLCEPTLLGFGAAIPRRNSMIFL